MMFLRLNQDHKLISCKTFFTFKVKWRVKRNREFTSRTRFLSLRTKLSHQILWNYSKIDSLNWFLVILGFSKPLVSFSRAKFHKPVSCVDADRKRSWFIFPFIYLSISVALNVFFALRSGRGNAMELWKYASSKKLTRRIKMSLCWFTQLVGCANTDSSSNKFG